MSSDKEKFDRDGYLIFDPGVDPKLIDDVRVETDRRFADPNEPARECADGRLPNAWHATPSVGALANAPRVLDVLRALYGREPFPFQTLNFLYGTEQLVHSDAIHFDTEPEGLVCGVWIALEDIHPDSGPLVFYPGSHKLPNYRLWDFGQPATDDGYVKFAHLAAKQTEPLRGAPHYALLKKGEAIVWSSNLWHGGSPRRDRARTRKSQVTHYFFEGAQYYTPRLATPGDYKFSRPGRVR